MIISDDGIIIRISLRDVGTYSRNTQGVKLINLNEGSKVSAVAVIETDINGEDENTEESVENIEIDKE